MPDKILLKVAYILGIIFGILECCTIFGAVHGIGSLICSFYLKKVYEMKDKEIEENKGKLLCAAIVLCFTSTLSGILALVYYIQLEMYNEKILKK